MGSVKVILGKFAQSRIRRASACGLLFAAAIIMTSCSAASGSGSNGAPPTATLTASPSTIVTGQAVTLTFTSTNGDSGSIDNGIGAVGLNGTVPLQNSTVPGYPTGTTTYTYSVTGPGGTATATATITVNLITSFDGMVQSDFSGSGSTEDVDPNGAVGTKQYMEYINASFQAYDKVSHNPVWPSALPIKSLWMGISPATKGLTILAAQFNWM